MSQRHELTASMRSVIGKETKKLRRDGVVPGVIYGPVIEEPLSVSVDMKEIDRAYVAYGPNVLIDLNVDSEKYTVYMRHMSIDRLRREPIHVEFFAPNLTVMITTSIPLMVVGEPANDDGVLTYGREAVEVRGLPMNLPAVLEVDVTGLTEIDQAIHLRDLTIPDDVELITDPEEMIVKLSAPQLEAVEDEEAGEGEEGAAADEADEASEEASSDEE
ncbi:MAG: 50S ribosomal protein L25 [Thermomicrobiales bacterium]|nr:50S ribosomal protein L25 [Thermomicrobiales bacterium]